MFKFSRKAYITKPPIGAVLNRSHPLAQGLVEAWMINDGNANTYTDLITGRRARITAGTPSYLNITHSPDVLGVHVNDAGSAARMTPADLWQSPKIGSNFSLVTRVYPTNLAARNGIYGCLGAADGFCIELGNGDGTANITIIVPGVFVTTSSNSTVTASQWQHFVFVKKGAGLSGAFYRNGQLLTLKTDSTANYTNAANAVALGYRSTAAVQPFQGLISFIFLYGRSLTATEAMQLYMTPWAMFNNVGLSASEPIIIDVPVDTSGRNFTVYPDNFNLVLSPDIIIDSVTADVGGNLAYSSLLNPLPTRKVEFDSTSEVEIVYDITGLPDAIRHITDIIIYNHNIALNGLITVQGSSVNNDWGNAPFEITQVIPEDRDTDPDALTIDYPSGLKNVLAATKAIHVKLGSDLYAYSYIRILIQVTSPNNPENISFAKLFMGTKWQTTVNYIEGWLQAYVDETESGMLNNNVPYFGLDERVYEQFKFNFHFENTDDARLVRHTIYDSGCTYCFISADYGNTNDWDEIRQHSLTLYGLIDIDSLKEARAYEIFSFDVNFIEAVI